MLRRSLFLALLVSLFFAAGDDPWQRQLDKFSELIDLVKAHYVAPVDEEKLVYGAIRGFLGGLDPHSYFLDRLSLRSLLEDQAGAFFGIGIRARIFEDRLTVLNTINGLPAERAGIQAGDIVDAIDGWKTKDQGMDQILTRLRGERGTEVEVKVHRDGVDELLTFRLKREKVPLESVSYAFFLPDHPGIAYVSIRQFGNHTTREMRSSLARLQRTGPLRGLILDLRGNPGGVLLSAVEMAGLFLPKGKTVLTIRGRSTEEVKRTKTNGEYLQLPVAVLISRTSASASEIVAGALQDYHRATIIGQRSWGKGLVETLTRLRETMAVALTTARYMTPSGRSLQRDYSSLDEYLYFSGIDDYDHNRQVKGGITPDIYVAPDTYSRLAYTLLSKGLFFSFAAGLIRDRLVVNEQFTLDDRMMTDFRKYLIGREIPVAEEDWRGRYRELQQEIEKQALSSRFSPETAMRATLRHDSTVRQAVVSLTAKKLPER